MKTILICTDFSAASVNAAIYGAQLAEALGGSALLFHSNTPQESFNQSPVVEQAEAAVASANMQLQDISRQMSAATSGILEIDTRLEIGAFFEELYDVCAEVNPYVVVMGSQGTTDAERFLLGSNSVHAMKTLNWPLLTVPIGAGYKQIERIGLASDFDNVVDTLPLDRVKRIVTNFNASLHIINVGKNNELSPQTIFETGLMQEMLNSLNPQYHFITRANVQDGIMDFTESNNIDLLLVFPKEYGFLEELFHKSMAKQLVLNCKVPIVVLRPQEVTA